MSEPITKAMLEAGAEMLHYSLPHTTLAECRECAPRAFRAMEAAREAEKVELSAGAKDLVLRLAMGEQPGMEDDQDELRELREHRLVEAGSAQWMVRWGAGEITPLPPEALGATQRFMFFRLTEKGAAWIARETSNG